MRLDLIEGEDSIAADPDGRLWVRALGPPSTTWAELQDWLDRRCFTYPLVQRALEIERERGAIIR